MIWKSRGDGINRKYDLTYDSVNRLTGANFNQYIGSAWGKTSGGSSPVTIDFSVSGLGYDANGNIQSMIQQGFKIGGTGTPIDSLTYTYLANSNKLSQVHDQYNDTASVLGDFHYKGTKGSSDYSYDGNGNLALDNNKALNSLYYNYLNLLGNAHIIGKGNINYVYDAGGTKLQKQVKDSTTNTVTYTSYLGEFQYTRRAPFSSPYGGSDTLQFISTEEGRARWAFHKHVAGDTVTYPEYDFVERDHLGNERVILTQQRDTTQYIATMEAANRATENALFYNIGTTCVARSSVPAPGYPNDTTFSSPNDSVSKLNGNGPTVGPAIILKVMSGDIVDVGTQYYYNTGTYTSSPPISAQNLLNSLASGLATLSSAASESITTLSNPTTSPLLAALTSSINNESGTGTTKPQAYLNWVLLDKQFRYVAGSSSGALQVGAAGQNSGALQPPLAQKTITMSQSGYLYIYVSNATKGWDVFFDNMSVHLCTRQLVEENHYYPFGLTMAGISDKAIKTQYAENKYRYNKGSELQNKEFADGSGLEVYETQLRTLDPQLGRWWQVDPKTDQSYESVSPYAAMNDDPSRYNDPNGDEGEACCDVIGAWSSFRTTQKIAAAAEVIGGGPEDPVADAAATVVEVGGGLYALGKLIFGSSPTVAPAMGPPNAAKGTTPPSSSQAKAEDKKAGDGPAKPRNAPAPTGTPNSSKIEAKDKTGKTTKYSTYDENGKLVKQVEADKGEPRHGTSGATKKVPTENTLPDGTVKPGKPEIKPATPDETPPGTNH